MPGQKAAGTKGTHMVRWFEVPRHDRLAALLDAYHLLARAAALRPRLSAESP